MRYACQLRYVHRTQSDCTCEQDEGVHTIREIIGWWLELPPLCIRSLDCPEGPSRVFVTAVFAHNMNSPECSAGDRLTNLPSRGSLDVRDLSSGKPLIAPTFLSEFDQAGEMWILNTARIEVDPR